MHCTFNRWAGGKARCLTMSYDDGRAADRRLVDIFNRRGVRGSFHLNASFLGRDDYVTPAEVAALLAGHEVSAHGYTHPFLAKIPLRCVVGEILDDRRALEDLAGYPVRGMSYPFGSYNQAVIDLLPTLGIEYARTVGSHGGFGTPENLLAWGPTCHHNHPDLLKLAESFLAAGAGGQMNLLYVWGHSYEFDHAGNWHVIEDFCKAVAGDRDTWYATNIEIADYLNAVRRLRFSVDGRGVFNPSAVAVWVSVGDKAVEIPAGTTVTLA